MQKDFDEQVKHWKEQLETPRYASNLTHLVTTINKYMNAKGTVLEIGCGISNHLQHIETEDLYALDTSKALLDLNTFPAKYSNLDVLKLPDAWESKFNTIFCNGLIHHIKDHTLLMQNIRKCLKNGGLFIFLEPTSISLSGLYFKIKHFLIKKLGKEKVTKMSGFIDEDEEYINYFQFKKFLIAEGFSPIKYYTRQLIRLPPLRMLRHINVEPINNKFNIPWIGTTLIGVWMNEK